VTGAAANALLKVDGEGNIYINAGKKRKHRKETRKVKKTPKYTTKVVVP
jgi:hypothetical protein